MIWGRFSKSFSRTNLSWQHNKAGPRSEGRLVVSGQPMIEITG